MGRLMNGEWRDEWYDTESTGGRFEREATRFRRWITADGTPVDGVDGGSFKAEYGRYHLYVAYACPWAHRTLIFRALKNLGDVISVSSVAPHMLENGWEFKSGTEYADPLYGSSYLYEIYTRADPGYTGRVTTPVLWDKQEQTIVNNESSEIIRMLNSAFEKYSNDQRDFFPQSLQAQIEEINAYVYNKINNGVYKAGFATTQSAYEESAVALFEALDRIEELLREQRYLTGGRLTEADWRLFTTLVRFDAVYYTHFKCNRRRIQDYPNLFNYTLDLYQHPGVAETVDFEHIKQHYYYSHRTINPHHIVPIGPEQDFDQPHDRARLFTT